MFEFSTAGVRRSHRLQALRVRFSETAAGGDEFVADDALGDAILLAPVKLLLKPVESAQQQTGYN